MFPYTLVYASIVSYTHILFITSQYYHCCLFTLYIYYPQSVLTVFILFVHIAAAVNNSLSVYCNHIVHSEIGVNKL